MGRKILRIVVPFLIVLGIVGLFLFGSPLLQKRAIGRSIPKDPHRLLMRNHHLKPPLR